MSFRRFKNFSYKYQRDKYENNLLGYVLSSLNFKKGAYKLNHSHKT